MNAEEDQQSTIVIGLIWLEKIFFERSANKENIFQQKLDLLFIIKKIYVFILPITTLLVV